MSLLSIYSAYNLIEDIRTITYIYLSTQHKIDNIHYNVNTEEIKRTYEFLLVNMIFSISILSCLWLLLILFINTKIIDSNLQFNYIKNVLGKSYYYFYKLLKYTSNTNKYWTIILFIILIIACILSISVGFFWINYIDMISESHINYKK